MKVATRNSLKYCSLAPIGAGLLIPRLLLGNLKIIMKKVRVEISEKKNYRRNIQ